MPTSVDPSLNSLRIDSFHGLATAIGRHIRSRPTILQDEKHLQDAIEACFVANEIEYVREQRLDEKDRPDFLIRGGSVAVEVKRGSAGLAELRQVGRYIEHDTITAVLFIATRFTHRLPTLCGKPIYYVDLWKFQI